MDKPLRISRIYWCTRRLSTTASARHCWEESSPIFDRESIRQRFITTDIVDTPVIELYRRFGFTPVQDNGCVTLAKYVF